MDIHKLPFCTVTTMLADIHGRFTIACGAWCGRLCPPAPCSWVPELDSRVAQDFRDSSAVEFGNPGAAIVAAGTTANHGSQPIYAIVKRPWRIPTAAFTSTFQRMVYPA